MSITRDRQELADSLSAALSPFGMKVLKYAPVSIKGKLAWIEPLNVVPDNKSFDSLRITWQLTLVASSTTGIAEQQRLLDVAADAAVAGVIAADTASLENVGEYFAIADAHGNTFPAARLTLESYTSITD